MNRLFCLTILFVSVLSFAQEKEQRGVLVSNSEKGKSHLVIEGYMVKVFTKDTKTHKGILGIHDANTIIVNKEHIKLSDIVEFRGNDRKRNVIGKTIMLSGGGLFAATIVTFIITGTKALSSVVTAMIITGSVGIAAIGTGAAFYVDKRNYKASDGWTFQVTGPLN